MTTFTPNMVRVIAPVILCLGVIWLHAIGAFDGLRNGIEERRAQFAARAATGEIAFVAIDQESLRQIGVWPWPRSVHARLIDALVANEAADIVFDIDFSSRSTAGEDERLLESLQAAGGSVVFPTFAQPDRVDASGMARLARTLPHEMFRDDIWLASVQVVPDANGQVHNHDFGVRVGDEIIPSVAAILAGVPEMKTDRFRIDFSIDPGSVPTYSVTDLLAGKVPDGALRDKSIIVGAHALELRDTFAVPVHALISGPLLQVLAAETLLQDRILMPSSIWLDGALVLLALAVMLVSARIGLAYRLIALATLAVFLEAAGFFLQKDLAIVVSTAPAHAAIAVLMLIAVASEFNLKSLLLHLSRIENLNTKRVLGQVFADSADGFLIVDQAGRVLEINDNFRSLFDIARDRDSQETIFAALPEILARDLKSILENAGDRHIRGELAFETGEAESNRCIIDYTITLSQMVRSDRPDGGEKGPVVASVTARDVSIERTQRSKLEYLSKFDDLTGALRRREYVVRLGRSFASPAGEDSRITVMVINIHRFKALNSTLGRSIGDALLSAVARRLKELNLPVSEPARLDADTFSVYSHSESGKCDGRHLAAAIIRRLSKPYDLDGMQVSADFYVGLAEAVGPQSRPIENLVCNAELALDAARIQGGGGVAYYDSNHAQQLQRARLIEREMQIAVKGGIDQFHLAYQPQVYTRDRSPAGAEALLRWMHPEMGLISPGEFVDVAEATGLIVQLGRWVLNRACQDARAWPEEVTVAVNVSPTQLLRGGVVDDVRAALASSGLLPHRLELEITESNFLTVTNELLSQLEELKALGVSLALDDFGTGYSSLGYIANFPVDKIKVDQTFMRGLPQSVRDQSVIFAAQVLGEGLGIEVLCEGVETEEQYQLVRSIGCHKMQGYLFGEPMTAVDILQWFADRRASALKDAG